MKIRIDAIALLLPAVILCAAASARAASEQAGVHDSTATAPFLGGTRVMTTTFLPDPFIDTRVAVGIGYGASSDISTPLIVIDGEPVLGLEGSLLYAILGLDFRYAVRDRIAVWARINIAARLGSELQSILSQGLNAFSGFELGWLARLYESDRHLLSSAVMIRNGTTTIVDIIGFTNDVVEGVPDPQIMYSSPVLATVLDLRYGYALNYCSALLLLGQVSYGEAVEREKENVWRSGAGALASIDLYRLTGAPVGLTLGYKYSTVPELGDRNTGSNQSLMTGATYIGRDDFSIGLELAFQRTPVSGSDDYTWFTSMMISMQYYF